MPKIAKMITGTRVTSAPVAGAREDGQKRSINIKGTRQLERPAPGTGTEPPGKTGMKPKTRPTTGETATGKGY
jgi:hypothetical protein